MRCVGRRRRRERWAEFARWVEARDGNTSAHTAHGRGKFGACEQQRRGHLTRNWRARGIVARAAAQMPKRNLQRAAEDARIAGLLMHGIELCRAVKLIGIKADGFSMHTKDGLHEFVTDTHTLKDARRKFLDLPLDGFPGLAAADEAELCDRCLAFLKAAVCVLRNKTRCFSAQTALWLHENRIDIASFSHVGADGANVLQAWARLMKERVQAATKARIGARWDELGAIEQAREFHVEPTNCCIHGGFLGFSWTSQAAAKLTALSASSAASVRETRHESDHFAHACNLKTALLCGGKLLGCVTGYAIGKAHYFLIVCQRPQLRGRLST